MDNDRSPAKRLKYSPESLYAPRTNQLNASAVPFCLGSSTSQTATAADRLAGAPASLKLHNVQAPIGSGQRLAANAAPFAPRSSGVTPAATDTFHLGWQSGFGPSLFNAESHASLPDARAENIVKHVFEDKAAYGQVCACLAIL